MRSTGRNNYHSTLSNMQNEFIKYSSVWVEYTKSSPDHGGKGWEFGTCLWSPSQFRNGSDGYSIMRKPAPGDLVLHIYNKLWPDGRMDARFCGESVVATRYREVNIEPPSPGDCSGMAPYYRIDLEHHMTYAYPVSLSVIREYYGPDIRRNIVVSGPKYYPFVKYRDGVQIAQRKYVSECTQSLFGILQLALGLEASGKTANSAHDPHEEYAEGRRTFQESYFFRRNASLSRDAKEFFGMVCQGCGFEFSVYYGDLGKGYIECHHLNPLSERSRKEWTEDILIRLDQVTVLCANCHRMVHRVKPALSIQELKGKIEETKVPK
jgi:hypothetical protein